MAYSETRRRSRRALLAAGVAGTMIASLGAAAENGPAKSAVVPDLIDTPAGVSPRAATSVQLAVTRAGRRLVSVGEAGMVLLSDDDGRTWRQSAGVPVSVTLTDVSFADADRGWAVGHGGVVLATRDGGENWRVQMDGSRAARLMVNEAEELAAAGDPGAERARRNAEAMVGDGPDKPFLGVLFRDADHGLAIGAYGLALTTSDGGASWRSIAAAIPNPGGLHLYRALSADGALTIVGEQGSIFRAEAGGNGVAAPFEAVEGGYEGTLFGAVGSGADALLVYGLKGNVWRGDPNEGRWKQVPVAGAGDDAPTITCGIRLPDGSIALGDESGRILSAAPGQASFVPTGPGVGAAITGMTTTADGALVVSSARGDHRVPSNFKPVEAQ